MNYIISEDIMDSLRTAQTLQEVELLLSTATEAEKSNYTNVKDKQFVEILRDARETLMRNFLWSKYEDDKKHFDQAHTELLHVIHAIEERGVLR